MNQQILRLLVLLVFVMAADAKSQKQDVQAQEGCCAEMEGISPGNSQIPSSMTNYMWYLPLYSWGYSCWNIRSLLNTKTADAKTQALSAHPKKLKIKSVSAKAKEDCCVERTNLYAKIFGGANFLQDTEISGNKASYHTGYMFAGSLGYCWRYGLHWEWEYAFRRNGIRKIHFFTQGSSEHGHFQTSSYMANFLWFMPLSSWGCYCWNVRPLVGTGIGYDFQQMIASNSRVAFNQKWYQFAWQLMAGVAYPIFCNTEVTVEYKFHQGGSQFFNHTLGIGLTYKYLFK